MKLNVDRAAKGNPGHAGGGGIILDSKGQFKAGYSRYYGITRNMVAEVRAL